MKILVYIPLWGRPKVVEKTIKQWNKQWVIPLFCLSPDDKHYSELKRIINGFNYVEIPNNPLGKKMNIGIYTSLDFDYDYFMNIGSDDILEERYYDEIKPLLGKHKIIGYDSCIVEDYYTNEKYYLKNTQTNIPIGAGRLIHRSILEELFIHQDINLYTNDKSCGLDTDSYNRIMAVTNEEAYIIYTENPPIIDIKSTTNINPIFQIKRHLKKYE